MVKKTAIVYVDGFNFYYGALKGTPYKWLNLETLFDNLLPDYEVVRINYFTARVKEKADPKDRKAPAKQKAYLKALESLSRVYVTEGSFMIHKSVARRRVPDNIWGIPIPKRLRDGWPVKIWKVEEKGSDVSLGSRLTLDAAQHKADLFVLVTSDSDLTPTAEMIIAETDAELALLPPHGNKSKRLERCGFKFVVRLSRGALVTAQFPETVTLPDGKTITRPSEWGAGALKKEMAPENGSDAKPTGETAGVV